MTTTLQFVGDWTLWLGGALAVVLAVAAFLFYRREFRARPGFLGWLLPSLRALAVFLIVLMLAGPILRHREVIGELTRLLIFVDASQSMGLKDAPMPVDRKLRIATARGWLPAEAFDAKLLVPIQALEGARAIGQSVSAESDNDAVTRAVSAFRERVTAAADALEGDDAKKKIADELVKPADELARREIRDPAARDQSVKSLGKLTAVAAAWEARARKSFADHAEKIAASPSSPVAGALRQFDALSRWERAESLLLAPEMLAKLARRHRVQVIALEGDEARDVWSSSAGLEPPKTLGKAAESPRTNLTDPLRAALGDDAGNTAVVLLSDGRQTSGASPVELAELLGSRKSPAFTIGLGSDREGSDLAVGSVEAPRSVFFEDRIRGSALIKDGLPDGGKFAIRIEHDGETVWKEDLAATGTQARKVAFDFSVKEIVERLEKAGDSVKHATRDLDFRVILESASEEAVTTNNTAPFRVRAMTQKRRVLLADSRPRWEYRYLRNLFERNGEWESTAFLEREADKFPADEKALAGYDLVILGGVSAEAIGPERLQWIADFVGKRGGGLILIDSGRKEIRALSGTALGPLIPVKWLDETLGALPDRLAPTIAGSAVALASNPAANEELYRELKPPHSLAPVEALPGSETLIEAGVGERRFPAVVMRSFGAGRVFYAAFDDTWRWRHGVADEFFERYWLQVAGAVSERPFAVSDAFTSLDAGSPEAQPGERAAIRARLRDENGAPVVGAKVSAVLYRDGERLGYFSLAPDGDRGGLYRGETGALEAGEYEIALESDTIAAERLKPRARFEVGQREFAGELTRLDLDEELLRRMAALSGGRYFREEDAAQLPDALAPLSEGRVIESETVLAQSWWWFLAIVTLFTTEWIIRKRSGLL